MDSERLEQIRNLIEKLAEKFVIDEEDIVLQLVEEELDSGSDDIVRLLWTKAISPAMNKIGKLFQDNYIYIPEILTITKTIKKIMGMSKEKYPPKAPLYPDYPIVIGTVRYDLHDIGKNLFIDILEAVGFPVFDLGTDVEGVIFAESVINRSAKIVAVSCLLTNHLSEINEVTKKLAEYKLQEQVKVIVGGAAVTEGEALKRGADAYGRDAWEGVEKIRDFIGLKSQE